MSTASAQVLEARLRLRLATTDSKAHYPVLPYTNDRTGRDAIRGKDDRLHKATVDGGWVACGHEMVPAARYPHPVFTGEDNGLRETKAKRAKAEDVRG
jgi:hypothetical protein